MCRLYGFISNEPTKVDCSLVYAQNALMVQSRVDERGQHHSDGWGIAIYKEGAPELLKKTKAAFADRLFSSTAERIYSTAILAHVRKATVGQNSIYNTHPFVAGKWTFAHNGTVTGFDRVGQRLATETDADLQRMRKGETDSEQYFLWLLTRLRHAGFEDSFSRGQEPENDSKTSAMTEVLTNSVQELAEHCQTADTIGTPRLNFVLTNGVTLFACRWNNSMHTIRREGLYNCEICGIPHIHHHETVDHRAVVVASEPVTHEQWDEVVNKSVFAVTLQPRGTAST